MIKINKETQNQLISLSIEKEIFLEGNVLKVIDQKNILPDFEKYLEEATKRDKEIRSKRLDVTKQIQSQNKELIETKNKLEVSLLSAERAKINAEQDLDVLRKKTQYGLIKQIIVVALFLIVGISLITSGMYIFSMVTGKETDLIGNMWSSMFGIILTNSFSIVGTIMGIKYVSSTKKDEN